MGPVFAFLEVGLIATSPPPRYGLDLGLTENWRLTGAGHMVLHEGAASAYTREVNGERLTIRVTPSATLENKIKLKIYIENLARSAKGASVNKVTASVSVEPGDPLTVEAPAFDAFPALRLSFTVSNLDRSMS
jgi:hypothetical protein